MSKKGEKHTSEHECIEFGCQHIFKCITFLGTNCTRQGGEKIPAHRVLPQGANQRPYPRSRMLSYFINQGEGR